MKAHLIDLRQYPRRAHFDYFRTLAYPYVGTTVDVDVTEIVQYCRTRKRSFYLAFMHAAALAADGVDAFRQRIRDGGIVEYEQCPTSHVELLEDGTYSYCTLHHPMDLEQYFSLAEKAREDCISNGITEDEDVESMYFISSLPWLHYSALIQPVAGGDESNPRLTWGAYTVNESGRAVMPVSVLAHHALVDGIHIARFYQNLEKEIRKFAMEE